MRLRGQILSVLNNDLDFFSWLEIQTKEPRKKLESATNEIINVIIHGINIQCKNGRSEEMCRIAKECSSITFKPTIRIENSPEEIKSTGANSELFSNRFGYIVDVIEQQTGVKRNIVKELFLIMTPIVLSDIYFNYKANQFTLDQLSRFVEKLTRSRKLSRELKYEVLRLTKDHSIEPPLRVKKSDMALPFSENKQLRQWWQRIMGTKIAEPN